MVPIVLSTYPVVSVPNVTTVPNVPKMTKNDHSITISYLVPQQNDSDHVECVLVYIPAAQAQFRNQVSIC